MLPREAFELFMALAATSCEGIHIITMYGDLPKHVHVDRLMK